MKTVSSVKAQEYFIVPNLTEKAKVLVKDSDGKIRVSCGPDHHGRIIYAQVVVLSPDTVVQLLEPWTVNGFLTD